MATAFPDDVANANPPPMEPDTSEVTSDWDEESVASSTQSLTESILEHVFENGRRYHRKSKDQYFLPSDDAEQSRLDLMHQLHLEILGGDISITQFKEDPANVLDCGCGTGMWALDFGDTHPGSQVIGLDLTPIQPEWTAPNVKFELDDLEKEWTFKPNYFNFIHSRHLATGIKNWPRYLNQVYHHLAPGGQIELVEHNLDRFLCDDETMPEDSAYHQYLEALAPCYKKLGVNSTLHGKDFQEMLEKAGFVDVKIHTFKAPFGTWAKDKKLKRLGWLVAEISSTGAEAYAHAMLTNLGGYSNEDARKIIDDVVTSLKLGKEHVYYHEYYVVGRKPQ